MRDRERVRVRAVLVVVTLAAVCEGPACSGDRRGTPAADPILVLQDQSAPDQRRLDAITQLRSTGATGARDREASREALKKTAWEPGNPLAVRAGALEALLSETEATGEADTRRMVRLMLAQEPRRAMVAHLCELIASRGWADAAPELVRSFARPVPDVPDAERAERTALAALFPGRPIEDVAFEQFVNPTRGVPIPGIDGEAKLRSAAWDLLARLDADGSFRRSAITSTDAPDAVLRDLRACAAELRCVPSTGDELRWLRSVRASGSPRARAWWDESARAIAALRDDQAAGFQFRHAEAVRWAAADQPSWLNASREELLSEIGQRLSARDRFARWAEKTTTRYPGSQTLADARDSMAWGDALMVLVIDDAVRAPAVRRELFEQARVDRADSTTEMGGLLEGKGGREFSARMFRPRSGERRGDEQFIASEDMIAASDFALAHYHFHVQRTNNDDYAGPSVGDMEYARRTGRACLVFTSVGERALNVDYYQRPGVVLDLGVIDHP